MSSRTPKISLQQKMYFEKKIIPLSLQISEYSFTNLFCYQEEHDFTLTDDPEGYLSGLTHKGFRYYMPIDQPSNPPLLPHYPIPDEWLTHFPESQFLRSFLEEESDYLFLRSNLAELPGRKLSRKRNQLYQLEKEHEIEIHFAKDNLAFFIKGANIVLEAWAKDRCDGDLFDVKPCQVALQNFSELNLDGYIACEMGIPYGFVIGERLTSDTYVIHFAKAKKEISGITAQLYVHVARNLSAVIRWINLEQDLGNPNLRDTKRSFGPDHLIKKWLLIPLK